MPDLNFEVVSAEAPAYAAVPTIIFKLRIDNAIELERIHSGTLRCQIRINVTRRHYSPEAQARLLEVFGEPKRWGETLRSLLWTHTIAVIPQFTGSVIVDLPIVCTYDFDVVSTKYFNALGEGEIPLTFLFSGTIFYEGKGGILQVGQVSWSKEASYRLPITLWQEMMEYYYPNTAWIRLHKDVFDQLYQYKIAQGLPTWDEVFVKLLRANGEEAHL
jgi:Family of unknown function (DUF6084)